MFPVNEDCKNIFTAIKMGHKYAYAIMKIKDREEVVLEKFSDPLSDDTQETNELVFSKMREDVINLGEARYILFDVRFKRKTGFMKDVVGYIYWCPDNISAWDKMIYASTNGVLRAEFKGTKQFEYHDAEDFNFQEMVTELRKKDRQ